MTVQSNKLFAQKEVIPENETEDETLERLRVKARKMMYNEKGVAYAPWMSNSVDEDVSFTFSSVSYSLLS
jgi:hypothetical protein